MPKVYFEGKVCIFKASLCGSYGRKGTEGCIMVTGREIRLLLFLREQRAIRKSKAKGTGTFCNFNLGFA